MGYATVLLKHPSAKPEGVCNPIYTFGVGAQAYGMQTSELPATRMYSDVMTIL